MAFKFIVLCSLLAIANAGVYSPVTYAHPAVDAVASTHEKVVRSFDGTVSQYSKAIDTPYSSVRKEDTRINNNVYTPAYAKTISYAAPAVTKTYVAPKAAVYTHHAAPVVSKTVYAPAHAPVTYAHSAPAVYAHSAPAVTYAAPAVAKTVSYAAPAVTHYNHGPAATTYSHSAPGVSAYGSSQTVHYSPAEMVSHMSFDGFGTHWGW